MDVKDKVRNQMMKDDVNYSTNYDYDDDDDDKNNCE